MIRMLAAAAAAALLSAPALAQDVSAGGASQDRQDAGRWEGQQQGQMGDQGQLPDQTARTPGEEGDAEQLDRDQLGQRPEPGVPPLADDQTAQVPEDEGIIGQDEDPSRMPQAEQDQPSDLEPAR